MSISSSMPCILVGVFISLNWLRVLFPQSLCLRLQFFLLLCNVHVIWEVDVNRDSQFLTRCVLVMQRMWAVQHLCARSECIQLIESFGWAHFVGALVLIELRHGYGIWVVGSFLLGSITEEVAQEVCVLLEDEVTNDRIVWWQSNRSLVIRYPIHRLW